jgi:CDP-2,3-bis-(O-geranylgeranyl)-sn-glycerol synthase
MPDLLVLFLLLISANGAPILAEDALGRRWDRPLDGGRTAADGHRVLGRSATWRGVIAAVLVTAGLAWLLGESVGVGALIGLLAMAGDAASSFVKRRLGLEPGAAAPGLDQVPESLLPVLAVAPSYGLGWMQILFLVASFTLFQLLISRLLYRLRLRKRPY